jgi:hypothetical protein
MDKIPYGQKVVATGIMRRTYQSPNKKIWVNNASDDYKFTGLLLGYRTLSNGDMEWFSDEGNRYTPREHFKVALVSPNERENPVYVPLDKIKAEYS